MKLIHSSFAGLLIGLPYALSLPLDTLSCPLTFDGRIPQNFTRDTFETVQSPFNPKHVLGQSKISELLWSVPTNMFNSLRPDMEGSDIVSRRRAIDL